MFECTICAVVKRDKDSARDRDDVTLQEARVGSDAFS